ncbi:MAG TPA: hypothetical protein VEC19_02840 [Usitatibacter sp.]|nr:hypothetical protein [Usitatibacter sp.]
MEKQERFALAVQLAAPHVDFKASGNPALGTNNAASRIVQAYEAILKAEQLIEQRAAATA